MGKKIVEALERENVIVSDLVMRCDGDRTLFTFDLLGLRRNQAGESIAGDEASVLERRLRRVFPEMSPPRVSYAGSGMGAAWRRHVEFAVELDRLEQDKEPTGQYPAREYQGIIQTI